MDHTERASVRSAPDERCNHSLTLEIAKTRDSLDVVNTIIASAIVTWPVAERLRRLAVIQLQYSVLDMATYEILMGVRNGCAIAVGAWEPSTRIGPDATRTALLHGLYVHAQHQRCGVGESMLQAVASRAAGRGFEGLLVKAQRVSCNYFQQQGFTKITDEALNYPYLYWTPVKAGDNCRMIVDQEREA